MPPSNPLIQFNADMQRLKATAHTVQPVIDNASVLRFYQGLRTQQDQPLNAVGTTHVEQPTMTPLATCV